MRRTNQWLMDGLLAAFSSGLVVLCLGFITAPRTANGAVMEPQGTLSRYVLAGPPDGFTAQPEGWDPACGPEAQQKCQQTCEALAKPGEHVERVDCTLKVAWWPGPRGSWPQAILDCGCLIAPGADTTSLPDAPKVRMGYATKRPMEN